MDVGVRIAGRGEAPGASSLRLVLSSSHHFTLASPYSSVIPGSWSNLFCLQSTLLIPTIAACPNALCQVAACGWWRCNPPVHLDDCEPRRTPRMIRSFVTIASRTFRFGSRSSCYAGPRFLSTPQGVKAAPSKASSFPARPRKELPKETRPGKRSRFFDEHTISIWAQNMVKRGGQPTNAVQLILNRMDKGRAHQTTALYNSALDICGHHGLLVDAASILHKMIAKNVRPDQRTVASLMNAMAEHAKALPLADDVSSTGSAETVSSQGSTEDVSSTRSAEDVSIGLAQGDQGRGLPGLEAFKVKSKDQMVRLAIKVYASWVEHLLGSRSLPVEPFNALLKVLWRCEGAGAKVLQRIFPLDDSTKNNTTWLPAKPDIISYTTAILVAQFCPERSFDVALQYWNAFVGDGVPEKSPKTADSKMILALLVALQRDLFRRKQAGQLHMERELILSRRAFLETIMTQCQGMPAVHVGINNILLNTADLLGSHQRGISYWKSQCAPLLRDKASIKECAENVNEETVANYIKLLNRNGQREEALDEVQSLIESKRLRVNAAIYNVVIFIHRVLGQAAAGQDFIKRHLHRLSSPINSEVVFQTLAFYHEVLSKTQAKPMIAAAIEWFKKHPENASTWERAKQKNYILKILDSYRISA